MAKKQKADIKQSKNSKKQVTKGKTKKEVVPVKKQKPLKKIEEEIDEIENENELFDQDGYYKCEGEDDDWGDQQTVNLSEHLFAKMNEIQAYKIDPRVVEAYTLVGDILQNYTSGKLPKAFNILPVTENWEELISISKPERWSPQAMYEATIMFSSNLNSLLAQTFYTNILLPAIRADIRKNKKLNIHYYNCLKKAIFKPAAFFKGIIIPLSENPSFKEANIIGSILRKCSIPVTHSSACLMKFVEDQKVGNGVLYFMKILLLKKYALPTPVKNALVEYFFNSIGHQDKLPVMWHQTLLTFVQIYKLDLNDNEKNKIKTLVNKQNHHLITDEILRELNYKQVNISLKSNMMID
jgi:essential nuclear protein 1